MAILTISVNTRKPDEIRDAIRRLQVYLPADGIFVTQAMLTRFAVEIGVSESRGRKVYSLIRRYLPDKRRVDGGFYLSDMDLPKMRELAEAKRSSAPKTCRIVEEYMKHHFGTT